MKARILRFLGAEHNEAGRVGLLLIMSFFMGVFLATLSVGSQTLFLQHFDPNKDLPVALLVSGAFGLFATLLYNFLQNRIPFQVLAILCLAVITSITAFIEFGEGFFKDPNTIYFLGFTQIIPFSFVILLIFWGSFNRLFNLRQAKRLVGVVDQGAMVASILAFFSIPIYLGLEIKPAPETLYTISLFSIGLFLVTFLYLSFRHLNKKRSFAMEKATLKKLGFTEILRNKYLLYLSLFIVASMMAFNFVEYSFLNVTNLYADQGGLNLASFISYFEMTIVIFTFLLETLAADKIMHHYGMRVSLLVAPVLIGVFTVTAFILGSIFGYTPDRNLFVVFFLMIALSRLIIASLRSALDEPVFKLYLLPVESHIRIDVQTKIEGVVTAFAMVLAGGLIILIQRVEIFDLIYITLFTLPLIGSWYFITNRLHTTYRHTLQNTLLNSKQKDGRKTEKEYNISRVLENEVNSSIETKIIYGLKLMEKLEPALFENTVVRLTSSENPIVKDFALKKIEEHNLSANTTDSTTRKLAKSAAGEIEDSDLLSIEPDKLLRLSKSIKPADRILAAKLLRKLVGPKTIFILLELLRDIDPKVRYEALNTVRKTKRPETWSVLIELLASPSFSHHAAAALKEAGESVLPTLEAAFHRSGQQDIVMLRIVQIMGRIGGRYALQLLWKKADYPDKRIVKQILYSLRLINYQASGKELREVMDLLETEISKTLWNLAALHELPVTDHFFYLREALQEEVKDNYDQVYMLLSIMSDPQSVQLVRDNIESGDPDNIAFAMELLDLFIDKELKPKLLPLLDDSPVADKLKNLQIFYPRESYNPVQVVNYILNRDFNLNNRWTKACAIHASAYIADFRISRGLVAQMFNRDKLLQESAAWVIYNKDQKAYQAIVERLPERDKRFLDSAIENNRLLDGLNDGFFLWIEKVMFIKQLPAFKNIHGILLCDLADRITPYDLTLGERVKLATDDYNNPVLIAAHGEVKLYTGDREIIRMKRGEVYGDLFQNGNVERPTQLIATERSVVFAINLMDFYYVMANHHELVQGIVRNVLSENEKQLS